MKSSSAVFFDELGDTARTVALKYFRKELAVDETQDKSPVTQADREIEQNLRALTKKTFPAYGVIGEEFGKGNPEAEFVWVIDPIDGTKAFATGRPTSGTIIGLAYNGVASAGLIDQAFAGKMVWRRRPFLPLQWEPVKVAPVRSLAAARFHTTVPSMFDGGYEANLDILCRSVKWPIFNCDCYAYGLLALGWIDLIVEKRGSFHPGCFGLRR